MSNDSLILNEARDVTLRLVDDWRRAPHSWELEIDVQAELAGRLRARLAELGVGMVPAAYDTGIEADSRMSEWSRVTCEPTIHVPGAGKIKPDIVVRADLDSPANPPEPWPLLLVYEIKYPYNAPGDSDIEKLRSMVRNKIARRGIWLHLHYERSPRDIEESTDREVAGIEIINAWLPSAA